MSSTVNSLDATPKTVQQTDKEGFSENAVFASSTKSTEMTKTVFQEFQCNNCRKEDAKFLCGRCKNVSYCSAECQKLDWNTVHKSEGCAPPAIYSEEEVIQLVKDAFKSTKLCLKTLHFLFKGETGVRRHNLAVINNPDCLKLYMQSNVQMGTSKIIATNGRLSLEFSKKLSDEIGNLHILNGIINGKTAYDIANTFSAVDK